MRPLLDFDKTIGPNDGRRGSTSDRHGPRVGAPRVRIFDVLFVLVLCFVFSSSVAMRVEAADPGHDERSRWAFSAAFEAGVLGHTGKGNVSGTTITDGRFTTPAGFVLDLPAQIVQPDRSREEVVSALLGGTLGVMSPEVFRNGPRLFVDLNISEAIGPEVGFAREADPDFLRFPESFQPGNTLGESVIEGRGHKVTARHQGPQIHAGIGPAFTVDIGSHRLRIKPSLVYSRIPLDVYGVVRRAVRQETPPNNPDGSNPCTGTSRVYDICFRSIAVQSKQREIYHGIGPALELEYDTRERLGPIGITLYIKGHASRLFGDVTTELAATNRDPRRGTSNETVFFKYSQDRWIYRAATGIRFRWSPRFSK